MGNAKKLFGGAGAVVGVALVGLANPVYAESNPFALPAAGDEQMVLAAAGEDDESISVLEGKCGEGKCGSERIRNMMDDDKDGQINRGEYVAWTTKKLDLTADQAGSEFDKFAKASETATADAVFQSFIDWQY